jgi:hypothetical protein
MKLQPTVGASKRNSPQRTQEKEFSIIKKLCELSIAPSLKVYPGVREWAFDLF